jgi:hypothetical protein
VRSRNWWEGADDSEKPFHHATRRHKPDNRDIHIHYRKNRQSHQMFVTKRRTCGSLVLLVKCDILKTFVTSHLKIIHKVL